MLTQQRTRSHTFSARPFPAVTAWLLAARLEEDNAIHLLVADPADHSQRRMVAFPDTYEEAGLAGEMRRARQCFIDALRLPSFEGWTLLYGVARLTLTDDGGHGLAGYPQVLGFELLAEREEANAA